MQILYVIDSLDIVPVAWADLLYSLGQPPGKG